MTKRTREEYVMATVTRVAVERRQVKKRVSAARARATVMATATWVAGDEEGKGNGSKGDSGKCDGDKGEGRRQRG